MLLDAVNLRKTTKTDRIKVAWFYPAGKTRCRIALPRKKRATAKRRLLHIGRFEQSEMPFDTVNLDRITKTDRIKVAWFYPFLCFIRLFFVVFQIIFCQVECAQADQVAEGGVDEQLYEFRGPIQLLCQIDGQTVGRVDEFGDHIVELGDDLYCRIDSNGAEKVGIDTASAYDLAVKLGDCVALVGQL